MALRSVNLPLTPVVRRVFRRHGFAHTYLLTHWPYLAGPEIAALARPEALHPDKRNGGFVLVIRVTGAAAVLLQHDAPRLIARINAACGANTVTRLHCVQGPLRPPSPLEVTPKNSEKTAPKPLSSTRAAALEQSLAKVRHPDLRATLNRLGHHVMDTTASPKTHDSELPR